MSLFKKSVLFYSLLPTICLADGLAIDKVYHPYVQPLEREIEWRMIESDGEQIHRLGFGKSVSKDLFLELYVIGNENQTGDIKPEAYELEAKWQLSEQGEYRFDWGLLTELEHQYHDNNWELATTLLMEKELGRWSVASNFGLAYEWGDNRHAELESDLRLQTRYRLSPLIEPALELYANQDTRAVGPVLLGDLRFAAGKKLHWEMGILAGLDSATPDKTWRFLAEFEF